MHTCFYVKSSDGYFKKEGVMFEKGGFLSFNSVKSDFAAAMKEEGKLFDKIAVSTGGEGESEKVAPCEFVSARAVSDKSAELCFKGEFDFSSETVLSSAAFVSEGGKKINAAAFPSGYKVKGKTEIFATAYFEKSGSVGSFGEGFCEFILHVTGVKTSEITAGIVNSFSNDGGRLPVSVARGEEGATISFTVPERTEGKYAVIYADGKPAFYVSAKLSDAGTEIVSTGKNVIAAKSFYKEISLIADSAVNLSDVKTRAVALTIGKKTAIEYPFTPSLSCGAEVSPSNENAAISCEKGIVCFKRDGKFFSVNPFSNETHNTSFKSFCISGGYLYVLGENLKKIDLNTGKLVKSYSVEFSADKVFGFSDDCLILCGDGGFTLAQAGDTLIGKHSVSVSGGKYAFDKITSVLTVFTSGEVRQYSVLNSGSTQIASFLCATSVSNEARVAGRYKKAFLAVNGVVRVFDLAKNIVQNEYFAAANDVVPDGSGTYFVVSRSGGAEIFRYDNDFVSICEIDESEVVPAGNGFVSGTGVYPFGETANRFEILSSSPSGKYTILKEVPFFEGESAVFTLKGVV